MAHTAQKELGSENGPGQSIVFWMAMPQLKPSSLPFHLGDALTRSTRPVLISQLQFETID
jgi:hypothetical protein